MDGDNHSGAYFFIYKTKLAYCFIALPSHIAIALSCDLHNNADLILGTYSTGVV